MRIDCKIVYQIKKNIFLFFLFPPVCVPGLLVSALLMLLMSPIKLTSRSRSLRWASPPFSSLLLYLSTLYNIILSLFLLVLSGCCLLNNYVFSAAENNQHIWARCKFFSKSLWTAFWEIHSV